MSIYVTGDLHGTMEIDKLQREAFPEGQRLSKSDFLVILGDFGFVWQPRVVQSSVGNLWEINPDTQPGQRNIPDEQEEFWLEFLSKQPWTTLFIDGNHENFDRLLKYPVQEFYGGKASRIHDTVWYLRRGEVFELNGKKCFVMGGAVSVDKMWRVPGQSWWPQEVPSIVEYQHALETLENHAWQVDYVFTHTPPESIRREIPQHFCDGEFKGEDQVTTMLEAIRQRLNYQHWYFGHFHKDRLIDERHTAVFAEVLRIA